MSEDTEAVPVGSGIGPLGPLALRYERNRKGGLEVWAGSGPRRNRQYVCYLSPARIEGGDYQGFVLQRLKAKGLA